MSVPVAVVSQYKASQRLQSQAALAARRAWGQVQASSISESWEAILRSSGLIASVSAGQLANATAGASYSADALAQQGLYEPPEAFVNPAGFAGVAADGRTLEGLLYSTAPYVKTLIGGGMDVSTAMGAGAKHVQMLAKTTVADAGRGAAGVDIASRRGVGYVRMLNPPSCSRCSVLAGKFYRWNTGFRRHPGCDCVHVASTDKAVSGGKSEGLIHDPYEYFHGLSEAEQNKLYTKAGAQAIRDGADLFQVVNSRRGMKPGGLVTTEGTSRRGNFGRANGPRLTPEAIYQKNLSRAETLKELERYGYILPGGQDPLGAIRGQRDGFGALGRGGTRVGARQAALEVRRTGERKPNDRYNMTEAERRLFEAQLRWNAVREGRNPYSSKKPLTPDIAARVEKDFRRWLATGGQVF
ncbi:hypothetical protein [Glutamicibacter soli]|uniref:hypothetical protein n=1 Tax=Glutamicibacter soli TaxID=453836 RepID=UPI003FD214D3